MPGLEFRYVGQDRLPTRLPEFDVERYFALTDSDIVAINERFRHDRRTGAAIQLVFLRASGHALDHVGTLPRQLLGYVSERLGLPTPTIASLRTLYQRYKTQYDHQVWACEYLGLVAFGPEQRSGLEAWMRRDAAEALTIDELIQHAHYWPYERRILIPAERTLTDSARAIWAEVERGLLALIEATVPRTQLVHADSILATQHEASGVTVLEWLKTLPARHSPSTITETFAKVRFLKELGTHTWTLDAIPIEKQCAYAQRIQARRPVKTRELKASTRTIELIFFLRVALLELTDALLYQTGRRISDLVRGAYDRATSRQARSALDYRQKLIEMALVQIAGQIEMPLINKDALLVEEDRIPDGGRCRIIESESSEIELPLANAMHQLDA